MVRVVIISLLAVLYGSAVITSFYLKIVSLLFFLALPWSVIVTILSFFLVHMFGDVLDYWLLSGTILNLVIFLWLFLFKPLLDKSFEISG
jgi:hypothetical protein